MLETQEGVGRHHWVLVVSSLHVKQPTADDICCSLRSIFILADCFPALADRTANSSYKFLLSQGILPFPRLFFIF